MISSRVWISWLPKIGEDWRRGPKKIRRCFDHSPTNLSVVKGTKEKCCQTWYPHTWGYHVWQHFSFVPLTTLKFVGEWSKHLRVFFGRLRQSSAIFGNLHKMFGNVWRMLRNVHLAFGTILENLRKCLESGQKSSENRYKWRHQHVHIIKRTLHISSKIWILCSHGKNNFSPVHYAHAWDIVLAPQKNSYLLATM